jgi:hypothetical protein
MFRLTASSWVEHFMEYLGPIPECSVDAPDYKIVVESLQCPDSNEWVVKLQVGPRSMMYFNESECHQALRHFDLIRSLVMPEPMSLDYPNSDHTSV